MTANGDTSGPELVPDFPTRVMLIERSILIALVIGVLTGALAIIRPFTTPILFGTAIAVAAWPIRNALVRCGVSRGLTAASLLLLSVLFMLIPMLMIAPHLADQLSKATQHVEALLAGIPERPSWIERVPVIGGRLSAGWDKLVKAEGDLLLLLEPYRVDLERWLVAAARGVANSLLEVLLSLIAATMFWNSGDRLVAVLHDALRRLGGPVAERAIDVAAAAIRGVIYGVIGTAGIQAAVLTIGLVAAGIPGAAMLGFLALLLAISQIGAPLLILIWGGAAWWLFRNDHSGWGTFMIAWGIFVSTVDNVVRPWLIGFGIDMPLSLTVLGVFGGFIAFGFLGLFVGPTLIAVVYTLLMAWRAAVATHPATATVTSASRDATL